MPVASVSCRSAIVYHPDLGGYDFGPHHPLRPERLEVGVGLLQACDLWHPNTPERLNPVQATDEELALAHSPEYVQVVRGLSREDPAALYAAARHGFGPGDNPPFPGVHEASALVAGGSLEAARLIMAGKLDHAFTPMGGLHHALRQKASGFCVYNDPALAIAWLARQFAAKVLYVDFDAHHGDGVQWLFYDDPRVLTVSFHETGRFLFPGTGDVFELGEGAARGFTVNVPMEPYTDDESWLAAIEDLLPGLVEHFQPDFIISNHGCDTHAWDPLAHLSLSTHAYARQAHLVHCLAHEHCQGRWIATGGGGYEIYRVVPRAWALLWADMKGVEAPLEVPEAWRNRWQEKCGHPLPRTMLDDTADFSPAPRRVEIERHNRRTLGLVRELAMPAQVRQAFPATRLRHQVTVIPDLARMAGSPPEARARRLDTPMGGVYMRDWCPSSFVERLRPDDGLCGFARTPDREHALLLQLAARPDTSLTVAHTPQGVIVGQVSLGRGDNWWEGVEGLYEVAVEVSRNYRRLGLATKLLRFTLEPDYVDELIVIASGYSWHWDTEATGLAEMQYREVLKQLFGSVGFTEFKTSEPNIAMRPANILLGRIGKRVPEPRIAEFRSRLFTRYSY